MCTYICTHAHAHTIILLVDIRIHMQTITLLYIHGSVIMFSLQMTCYHDQVNDCIYLHAMTLNICLNEA